MISLISRSSTEGRHDKVRNHEIERAFPVESQSPRTILGKRQVVDLLGQKRLKNHAVHQVVTDHENARHVF